MTASLPTQARAHRVLGLAEVWQLRAKIALDQKAIAWQLVDLVDMMLATGRRIGETTAVTWTAVDLGAGAVLATLPHFVGTNVTRPTPEQRRALVAFVVAQYQAGRSLREVAKLTGRTQTAVRRALDEAGVARRLRGAYPIPEWRRGGGAMVRPSPATPGSKARPSVAPPGSVTPSPMPTTSDGRIFTRRTRGRG